MNMTQDEMQELKQLRAEKESMLNKRREDQRVNRIKKIVRYNTYKAFFEAKATAEEKKNLETAIVKAIA